jgi:hypothetical protein
MAAEVMQRRNESDGADEWDGTANSVNSPKQVVASFPQVAGYTVKPPGFHSEGLYAVPAGLQPSCVEPSRHFRAGLLLVPSLRDWLPSFCLILLDGRAIVLIAGYIRHLADGQILIWTSLTFSHPFGLRRPYISEQSFCRRFFQFGFAQLQRLLLG